MNRAIIFFAAALFSLLNVMASDGLWTSDFSGPAGALRGRNGWVGRDDAVQMDGHGLAGLVEKSDGFAKQLLGVPENSSRIQLTAEVHFSSLGGSAMRNHHLVGKEQPAWIALGFMGNPSPRAGLAGSKLSVSVSSDGEQVVIGLGRGVGAMEPVFGVHQADGDGSGRLMIDYDFSRRVATAWFNGEPVLSAPVDLAADDFSVAGFQLRRMQPLDSNEPGGIEWIKIGYETSEVSQVMSLPEPEMPFGSRTNSETIRASEIERRIDQSVSAEQTLDALRVGWENPPATYRPHTRWWWPGNAVTREGIDFQLQEMKDKGLGGVEIMSFMAVFTQGNIDYNSDELVEMVKYAVERARALGLEVTPPLVSGWNHGHALVPEADGAKAMIYYETDVDGGPLALDLTKMTPGRNSDGNRKRRFDVLVAVALHPDGTPDLSRRIDLTDQVSGSRGIDQFTQTPSLHVQAELPAGRWRMMAFWTALTGQKNASEDSLPRTRIVDHMNRDAVERYLKNSGARFAAAFGGDYGQTVDSFFGDSFEVHCLFSFWSTGLYEQFEKEKGYDLRPWLPLLVYGGAPETPYVRYDFGHFMHLIGMESMVHPLADYAAENHVGMRQQPHYRFVSDIIAQAGVYQRPETENTKKSFEPMDWHKLATSGAYLYPSKDKKWVSAEAFTFINEKYYTTMEEIKRATDLFLRDGVTQFYNHGYYYTPEKELAPSRDLIWMNRISHVNTWWPWYRGLADYQARSSFLARQGRPECDVLVYAPYPTLWSERVEHPVHGVFDLPLGELPKILVANGYDFDCVNDDLLLHHADVRDGKIRINGFDYSVLVLPRVSTLSFETLEKINEFARSGGTVMALDVLPEQSGGLLNHEVKDARMLKLRNALFNAQGGERKVGSGCAWFFPEFEGLDYLTSWNPRAWAYRATPPLKPVQQHFVQELKQCLTPDFEMADKPQSDGLTFRHSVINDIDCWFITNLQPHPRATEITLKTKMKVAQVWDAMDGSFQTLEKFRYADDGRVVVPVNLEPWESMFVLLTPPESVEMPPVRRALPTLGKNEIGISNSWNVSFQGLGNFRTNLVMKTLADWTEFQGLENVSGQATYSSEFRVSSVQSPLILDLGEVRDVATVVVNGKEAGRVWMHPYRVDITKQVRPGMNRLEITVANRLWNWAAGLEIPTSVPAELQAHYGQGENSQYPAWKLLQDFKAKQSEYLSSGLLGPVRLIQEPDSVCEE